MITLDVNGRRAQNVKGQTLRRLLSNARQAFEFVDQFGNGFGVIKHCDFCALIFVRWIRTTMSLIEF